MKALTALLKKDWKSMLNLTRLVRRQSKYKIFFITAFAMVLLICLLVLFLEGFKFLDSLGGIGLMMVRHLFSVFFLGLGIMLIISNIITSYAAAFRSAEIPFLMPRPMPRGEIILHKLAETALLSSWAFFFIIFPFLGAYSLHERLSPLVVAAAFLFSIPFVLLCAVLGSLLTMLAVRWLPRFRPAVWTGALVLLGVAFFIFAPSPSRSGSDISFIMARLVPGMKVAAHPLSPSHWVAEGIWLVAKGQWARASLFMGLLISNSLFFGMIAERLGAAWYYRAWQRTLDAKSRRAARRGFSLSSKGIPFIARDAAAIILKDLRVLLRDPVQWTQGLLFFGLLGLYFINLRNLHYHLLPSVWRNLIAFLNIFSLSAVMSSFSSRFIAPQLSLEGQSFWVLGLSPLGMGRVLMIKFLASAAGLLAIGAALVQISTCMLDLELSFRLAAFLIISSIAFAFSGLATGLGAVFLDIKQRNPAAIISGFGGTLNLSLSLLFMCLAILPFASLFHLHHTARIGEAAFRSWLAASMAWLLIITALATALPLSAGRRSLIRRDY